MFGCLCYPNTSATTTHKLATRSVACVFLGYPSDHRGYRCYDIATRRVYTSRHVVFVEHTFPFRDIKSASSPAPTVTDVHIPYLDNDPPVIHAPRRAPAPASSSSSDQTPPHSVPVAESTAVTAPSAVADHAAPPAASDTSVPAPAVDPPRHSMVTRAKVGIVKPNPKYAFVAPVLSPVPSSVRVALRDPNW